MTMLKKVLYLLVSLTLVSYSISAQSTKSDSAHIFLPDVKVQKGNIIILPIKISNFDSCISTQFGMRWDSTMLDFQGVNDFGYPKMTLAEHFNLTNTVGGKLVFVWYDNSLKGIPAAQSKIIFNAKFKVIGNDAVTEVKFVDTPSSVMEVFSLKDKEMKLSIKNAKITIGNPVSTTETNIENFKIEDFSPNPIYENARLKLQINEPTDINIDFYDISGKNILRINKNFNIGTHFVEVEKNQFPNAGTFVYKVSTDKENTIKVGKIVVIK